GLSSKSYFLAVTPADAATIYNVPNPILNANYRLGVPYTGKGVRIGIVGDATIREPIVANYRARFLGDTAAPLITNVDGVLTSDNAEQAYIDTELTGSLAPAASIHLYTAADVFTAIERAISDNAVDILSVGF